MNEDRILQKAENLFKWTRLWAMVYYWLNTWLSISSLVVAAAVAFGAGMLLYLPEGERNSVNMLILKAASIGFVCQLVSSFFRLKDLASHNRCKANDLGKKIIAYEAKGATELELATAIQNYYEVDKQEPAP